ncbi:hypothetical protein GCM10025779_15070 [Arthrobacter cryoconiti]
MWSFDVLAASLCSETRPEMAKDREKILCPVGSEGMLDACQFDAGPSRANEKYAYQRFVMPSP